MEAHRALALRHLAKQKKSPPRHRLATDGEGPEQERRRGIYPANRRLARTGAEPMSQHKRARRRPGDQVIPTRNATAIPGTVRGQDGWITPDLRKVRAEQVRADCRDVFELARRLGIKVEVFESDDEDRVLFKVIVPRSLRRYVAFGALWREIFGRVPRSCQ